MKLNLESLELATSSLERATTRSEKHKQDEELRDAVIQRFEYTYELAWKMLKRQIEKDAPSKEAIDQLSYKELIREGFERGLIAKVEPWFAYREARNTTSHTYNEKSAKEVHAVALKFLPDVKKLLEELKKRN